MAFQPVDPQVAFPALEQATLAWWRAAGVPARALAAGDRSRPFVFFEGPPTANGMPGVHHVEARVVKDVVNRYQRMRGRYVVGARGGWDTHGLPVEVQVERELGFSGKADVERYGVRAFNAACRASARRFIREFEQMTERIGYWLDLEHPYTTFDNSYVESLWWVFKQLWQRDLLFRDYKVTMHCPRCGTSLSDHEVAQGFRDDVDDPSVWVRFPTGDGAALVAWTTTPWTLPANAGLAVHPDATYVLVEYTAGAAPERLLLAEARADAALGAGSYTVLTRYAGRELAGRRYEPLFAATFAPGEPADLSAAHRVVADEFVSLEDGTGVVHLAPAYGDLELGRKHGLPTLFSVGLDGRVLPEYAELGLAGLFFKDADALLERDLAERGLLLKRGRVQHSYPFCWRCSTPLLYFAKRSWYIRTTAVRERLLANNELVDWVPAHVKHGRFGNWLENNVDWAVSRERYWGTPLPIWLCDGCGQTEVLGSLAELESKTGRDLAGLDMHRPDVDEPTWACDRCGGAMRRVPDVADCWFDSGAMLVAQWHYPFENQELFEQAQQADFVAEGVDQTRGWFYTLHALSTLLFDRPGFKHVIGLGILAGADGRRMSKSRGTAVDPAGLLASYGADAVRWYMYASAPPYNSRVFLPEHVGESKKLMLTLWNTYSFFVTYANLAGWQPGESGVGGQGIGNGTSADTRNSQPPTPNLLDEWALARLHALTRDVTAGFERYDVHTPAKQIEAFVDDLSNWYVRRNRRRFWQGEPAAFATLHTCLVTLSTLLAPFMPFLSEALFQNLAGSTTDDRPPTTETEQLAGGARSSVVVESVHLAAWPQADEALIDESLLADTATLLQAISLGRAARRSAGLKVRQPLGALWLRVPAGQAGGVKRFEAELRDELNVKQVRYLDAAAALVEYRFKPNLRVVGKQYGKLVPALTQALAGLVGEAARAAAHAVEAGQPFELAVGEQTLSLAPEAVLVESSAPAGYAVAEGAGVLVALDTTVTPELRAEGLARELVRQVQDARKAAGLAISDRIAVTLEGGSDGLAAVIERWGATVQAETLAETLTLGAPEHGAQTSAIALDDQPLTLGLRRV